MNKRYFKNVLRILLPAGWLFASLFSPLVASDAAQKHESASVNEQEPVKAELVAKESSIQPGKPFWIGVRLTMQKGWDTYWLNPGDSGFPTQIKWDLPAGYTAGPLVWPYPERFSNESLVGFGYTQSTLLMNEITPPKELESGQKVKIGAEVKWLACNDSCIPGQAALTLTLPIKEQAPEQHETYAEHFAAVEPLLPKTLAQVKSILNVEALKEEIVFRFQPAVDVFHEIEDLLFIPEQGQMIDYQAPQKVVRDKEGQFRVNVKLASDHSEVPSQVKGVLLVSEKGVSVKKAIQVDTQLAPQKSATFSTIWLAFLFAFLGGMILNVMPCVLPVIALKIFSFVKMSDQKSSKVVQHGMVFSFGVLLSFWVLSGALLLMRAYGHGVGWGFQLQEPIFVALLTMVIFLLGLSLFGLFEFGTSMISLGNKVGNPVEKSSTSPLMGSFLSGILATLVATPCTGPMLGPAIGFAMTLAPISAIGIFTCVGLGMAFPYLFFSIFPKLVRLLPKPGPWMVTFKEMMGFLMMATVLWLLWVFAAQTGMMALFVFLAALVVMAIGAWVYGRWGSIMRKKGTRRIASLVALSLVLFSGYFAIKVANASQAGTQIEHSDQKVVFSPAAISDLRRQGKAVFVDFTAKWCLICQVNKVVLHSSEVQRAFAKHGVELVEADWTNRDHVITEEMEKLGRSGVPVYALYPADEQARPLILPQTLTAKVVAEYLSKL